MSDSIIIILVAVARAWPSARRLVFGCARFHAPEQPTLNAMHMVSQCCPCLEELALPALDLDLGDIEGGVATCVQPKEGTRPGARGHPLRVFRVASKDASAEISDAQAERVAEYVDGLFPNIDIKRSWVHDGSVEAILSDWYLVWVNITVTKALRTIAASEYYQA
ncbi:hypothetical protein BD413DRAFT_615958 [Trametes elegans]|nr:hypothetical protein BD413DRAFT_615958 [Trametes elegans]